MKIVLFIIFILWLIKVSRDILFWAYLWQLKEYRRDRMRAHFELPSARRIFLNKLYLGKIALFVSSIFLFIGLWNFFFQIIVSIYYTAYGARSVLLTYTKEIKEPVYTKKAIALLGSVLVFLLLVGVLSYAKLSHSAFLVTLLVFDILAPVLVTAAVGIAKFPSERFKKRIFEQARAKRAGFKDLLVIGITGSYGKTSMKEYLKHILEGKLKVLATQENRNNEIGVARCVLDKLAADHDVFIVEMGAYKEREIKTICDIVRPQIGILTGINEQHASLFGSLEQIIKAKYELIESLPRQGLAIFNGENDFTYALYEKTTLPKRMYALRGFTVSAKPDITAEKIDISKSGTSFAVKLRDAREIFETKVLGKHNVLNILGAILVAQELGMSLAEIKERVRTLEAPPHTLKMYEGLNGVTIIDDSYSANPRGVIAALDVLYALKSSKKVLVLHPLIELGQAAGDIHRRIGVKINKVCDICILTSPDFSSEITRNAPNTDVIVLQSPGLIVEKLEKILKPDDIVLLENRVPEEVKRGLLNTK